MALSTYMFIIIITILWLYLSFIKIILKIDDLRGGQKINIQISGREHELIFSLRPINLDKICLVYPQFSNFGGGMFIISPTIAAPMIINKCIMHICNSRGFYKYLPFSAGKIFSFKLEISISFLACSNVNFPPLRSNTFTLLVPLTVKIENLWFEIC